MPVPSLFTMDDMKQRKWNQLEQTLKKMVNCGAVIAASKTAHSMD